MKITFFNRQGIGIYYQGKLLPARGKNSPSTVELPAAPGEEVTLRFLRVPELTGKGWFFRALIFWIVGILGFFTPRYRKSFVRLDAEISLPAFEGGEVRVIFFHPKGLVGPVPAFRVEAPVPCRISRIEYQPDPAAKRHRTAYCWMSALLRIAFLAAIVCIAFL